MIGRAQKSFLQTTEINRRLLAGNMLIFERRIVNRLPRRNILRKQTSAGKYKKTQ